METLCGFLLAIAYFSIGGFVSFLVSDDGGFWPAIVIFWPIIVGFALAFIVVYTIPHALAEGIKAAWREFKKDHKK